MAQTYSFDVTTGVDLQEVDNAINQAQKEIAQRYDFKGTKAEIDFRKAESLLLLVANLVIAVAYIRLLRTRSHDEATA